MTVELTKEKGNFKHVYVVSKANPISWRRDLHTVTASKKSPFPFEMVFTSDDEMVKKVKRMAEIYGCKVEFIF